MKSYIVKGNVIEITLENGKVVKVSKVYIDRCIEKLDITMEDALLTWLEDEGYMENKEQQELCNQEKENNVDRTIAKEDFKEGFIVIQKGKKVFLKIQLEA